MIAFSKDRYATDGGCMVTFGGSTCTVTYIGVSDTTDSSCFSYILATAVNAAHELLGAYLPDKKQASERPIVFVYPVPVDIDIADAVCSLGRKPRQLEGSYG